MGDEEILKKVMEAFDLVRREGGLGGWGLDDRLVSPFSQELHATTLTVSLMRGESERTSIVLDPAAASRREGDVTVPGIADEIRRALRDKGVQPH